MPLVPAATFGLDSTIRKANPGDLLDLKELPLTVVNSDTGVTLTTAQLLPADIDRTGTAGGAISDTTPTAAQIIAALEGNKGLLTPPNNALYGTEASKSVQLQWPALLDVLPPGSSFRRIIRNNALGQTLTIAVPATSGISISGTATIATNKWREFLFRILNSTPSATLAVTTTNGNKILSAVDLNLINQITPGMSVYGTGIGASAKVVAVDRDGGKIYVDVNSSATGTLIGVTFTPTITIQNIRAGDV